jgi:hypothetical protein
MDVYVIQASRTASGRRIGLYSEVERARDGLTLMRSVYLETAPELFRTIDNGIKMRFYLIYGKQVGSPHHLQVHP